MSYQLMCVNDGMTGETYWGVIDQKTAEVVHCGTDQEKERAVCAGLRQVACPCPEFWRCRRAVNTYAALTQYM